MTCASPTTAPVSQLEFAAAMAYWDKGDLLVTAGADRRLRFWKLDSEDILLFHEMPWELEDSVARLAIHGRWLVAALENKILKWIDLDQYFSERGLQ